MTRWISGATGRRSSQGWTWVTALATLTGSWLVLPRESLFSFVFNKE
jgi:hypothetical protein